MSKLGYAIVGFGGIAEKRIAKEGFALDTNRFQPLKDVQLLGVTDLSSHRRKVAEGLGLKWYNSVDEICSDKAVTGVFIASNNLSHYPISEKLIKAGKHLIIEKPITTTLQDAKKLFDLAAEFNVSLAVDHMMVHNVYNIKARKLVGSNELGEINDIVLHMEFPYGFTPDEAKTWRCSNPDELGGPIGDVASHCLYMGEFLLNDTITSINCVYTPIVNELKVENGAFIRFETKKNIKGSVRVSFSDLRGEAQGILSNLGYEIYGNRKTLRSYGTLFQFSGHQDEMIKLRLEIDDFDKVEKVSVGDINNIYQEVIKNHAESITSNKRMSGTDALHNLELVLLAHQSAKHNGEIMSINRK
ncbi:Gfo/Idh/MocA family oxidoreductase [candidate division KSB1 bacterium]|nr:Gfo/Idh/MocA family oxidoreductase [candidate division KSB1 bacterium]